MEDNKVFIEIAVLDYNSARVVGYREEFQPDEHGYVQTEEIEKFLTEECNYNIDEIAYMFNDSIEWH